MIITSDMIDFVKILEKHKVPYAVVGGVAVNYYGYVRTTQDIDVLILPSRANAEKMLKVLKEFGFGGVGFSGKLFERKGSAVHLGVEPNRIDILTSLAGVQNSEILSNAKRIVYRKTSMMMISRADLIACKQQSSRLKDLADVEILQKTNPRNGTGIRNNKKKAPRPLHKTGARKKPSKK
jgi:hypothetical protein